MTKIAKNHPKPNLILASASPYRRQLLERLGLLFTVQAVDIDETVHTGESAQELVSRLSRGKAHAAMDRLEPDDKTAVIIGSDQVAVHDGIILGKPGDAARAREYLSRFSGNMVQFLTAVFVIDVWNHASHEHTDITRVHFRDLADSEIRDYVDREQPFDCAGGFKAESLGIVLFNRIESDDPTGLLGLPLIWVAQALRESGMDTLSD